MGFLCPNAGRADSGCQLFCLDDEVTARADNRVSMKRKQPLPNTAAKGDAAAADSEPNKKGICTRPHCQLTFIELFAGIGGFRVALERLGMKCVFACEIEGQARATYKLNFPEKSTSAKLQRDITQIPDSEFPPHDLLCGGFPCQPFTRLGGQEGLGHKRGQLYREILKILRLRQPKMFLLENVPGLATTRTPDGEHYVLDIILHDLQSCGYNVTWKIVDSVNLLPQTRKRIYLVGFLRTCGVDVESRYISETIAEGAMQSSGSVQFRFPFLPSLLRPLTDILHSHRRANERDNSSATPNERLQELSIMRKCQLTEAQWQKRLDFGGPPNLFIAIPELPSVTLTKSYRQVPGKRAGIKAAARACRLAAAAKAAESNPAYKRPHANPRWGWHNLVEWSAAGSDGKCERPRFYTPRECARLQGFPEAFRIGRELKDPTGPQAALFGNAVSPPVIAAIVETMLVALRSASGADIHMTPAPESPFQGAPTPIALHMLLEAVSETKVASLKQRILTSLSKPKPAIVDTSDHSGTAMTTLKVPAQVCFRWRDTGKCAWGSKCRWRHDAPTSPPGKVSS